MNPNEDLDTLAERVGIEGAYWDIFGNFHPTAKETKRALLVALGFESGSAEAIQAATLALEETSWRQGIDPVSVLPTGTRFSIPVHIPETLMSRTLRWELRLEDGCETKGECQPDSLHEEERRTVAGSSYSRRQLSLSASLPPGYHLLQVSLGENVWTCKLIATPSRAYVPPWMEEGERRWGIACQLYSLRTQGNWGMGDFSDLEELATHAAGLGATLVGINPIHALFPGLPEMASPYSPSSRLFNNPLYLDLTAVEEFPACEAACGLAGNDRFAERMQEARGATLVDYPAVATLKLEMLKLLFECFERLHPQCADPDSRRRDFEAFRAGGGKALRRYALFETLQQRFPRLPWPDWPEPYRDPERVEQSVFPREHARQIEFWVYVQWQVERQLAAVAHRTGAVLEDGLYRDMAVAPHPYGSDVWSDQALYLHTVRIGAPPDEFNPLGQNWDLPPMDPIRLRERAYAPFIDILRANMRHAGVLRIDHAIGLQHLFCVVGKNAGQAGSYLRYPFEDLLGILALESVRNQCLIVGEDLGTVPEGFRERLEERGILSYRVFHFERHSDGLFRRPGLYPERALTISGTHDMPSLRGYWLSRDLEHRKRLGLFSETETHEQVARARGEDKIRLLAALTDQNLLEGTTKIEDGADELAIRELILAVQQFIAGSPSCLMMVNLEDMMEEIEQINLPGTIDEHPNWRRKLGAFLDILAGEGFVKDLARGIQNERARPPVNLPG